MTTPEIQSTLQTFADPERLAFQERVCPTSMTMWGVTMPEIKTVLKEVKALSKDWSDEEIVARSLELVKSGFFELHLLGLEWISASLKRVERLSAAQIRSFNVGMDNWVSVDTYSTKLSGVAWRVGTLENEEIFDWLKHGDVWQRRIGVVSTVALNLKSRGGTGDLKRTLAVCERVVSDHHDMINKALSWALREVAKREPKPVQVFIDEHRSLLHSRVIREVERKLVTGRKNG